MHQYLEMAKTISVQTRSAIMTLRKEGYSLRNIASKLKIPYKGVQSTVKRFQGSGCSQKANHKSQEDPR